jgi:hypothetical protein
MPPIPTAAILSLSLGAICPRPATAWRGITVNPASVTAEVPRKPRRVIVFEDFCFMGLFFIRFNHRGTQRLSQRMSKDLFEKLRLYFLKIYQNPGFFMQNVTKVSFYVTTEVVFYLLTAEL